MRKRTVQLILACVLLVCIFLLSREAAEVLRATEKKPVIVVDAGHGGRDPGVVGLNDIKEKDINLLIALKVQDELKKAGYDVVLTRDSDMGLYDEGSSNMKMQDLKNRIALIDKTKPILTISVHQNSFPDESVSGPQVFFYNESAESRELAMELQTALNEQLMVKKAREIKSNESYYMLKHTPGTIAIVECGFLTNPSEVLLLQSEEYQQKIAAAIVYGIEQYIKKKIG